MSFPFPFSCWHLSFLLGEDNSVQCHSQGLPCPRPMAIWMSLFQFISVRGDLGSLSPPPVSSAPWVLRGMGKIISSPTRVLHPHPTPTGDPQAVSPPPQRVLLLQAGGNRDQNGIFMVATGRQTWLPPPPSLVCHPGAARAPQTPAVPPRHPLPHRLQQSQGSAVFGGSFLGGRRAVRHEDAGGWSRGTGRPQHPGGRCGGRRGGEGCASSIPTSPSRSAGTEPCPGGVAREGLKGWRADPPPSSRSSLLGCCCDRGWGRGWPPFAARRGGKRGCECVCVCVSVRVCVGDTGQNEMRPLGRERPPGCHP